MQHKVLYMDGSLQTGSYLSLQLAADGCPMLHSDAFVRLNGVAQVVDRGDNSGPGPYQGPCYWPGAFIDKTDLGSATSVTIEIGDDSQTVRVVLQPYSAGPIQLLAPAAGKAIVGGDIVVPFTVGGNSPPAAPSFVASGRLEADGGIAWVALGVPRDGELHFSMPASAFRNGTFQVQAGLLASCENAVCETINLAGNPKFPPPAELSFRLD